MLSLAGNAIAQQQNPIPKSPVTKNPNENIATESLVSEKSHPAVKISATMETEVKSFNDRLIAWSTVCLAVITAILAIFTAFLWSSTAKLVRGAEKTAVDQLRAYVHVDGVKIIHINMQDSIAHITVKNSGQTPAYDMTFSATVEGREFPLKSELVFVPSDLPLGKAILPPGGEREREVPVPTLIDSNRTQIFSSERAIYAFGDIRYKDAFGHGRFTKFRYMCFGDGFSNGKMSPCPEGNEAN